MKVGRKGYGEELKILGRYEALSEPYFKAMEEFLTSESKVDRKFAVKCLSVAFTKMIPQDVNDNHAGTINITIAKEVSDKYEVAQGTSVNSTGPAQV